jgi:hypothetical protein
MARFGWHARRGVICEIAVNSRAIMLDHQKLKLAAPLYYVVSISYSLID